MEEDVKNIVLTIASYILKFAGFGDDLEANKKKAMENIENGKAYKKFIELVGKQGGDTVSLEIGAGRMTKEDKIDHLARNCLK